MKKTLIFGLTLVSAFAFTGCSTSNEEAIMDRLSHQLDRTTNAVNLVANDNANELTLEGVSKLFNDKATQTDLTTLSNAYQASAKSAASTSESSNKIHWKIKRIKKSLAGGIKLGNENASAINDLTTSMQKYTTSLNKTKSDYLNKMPTSSRSEHNGYFLDPANPKVQEFLIKLLTEIICVYKPDGINLDYIRYPQAITKNESGSWGYTEYARSDFKDLYGVDPVSIKYSDDNWKDWENYRREKITNFVAKVGTLGRSNKVYISTVIFPDVEAALNTKQQDWRTWSKRDFVDGFTALFLTYDPKMLSSMMSDVMKIKSGKTNIYAGIFVTFMGGSNEDLVRQIHETRKLKADGVILFDYAHTKPEQYSKTLSNGAFKQTKKIEPQPEPKKKKRGFWIFGKKK